MAFTQIYERVISMFVPMVPPLLVRKKRIINKLLSAGAVSPEKAVTLSAAGIINENVFPRVTKRLEEQGIIVPAQNGKYWLNKERL